MFSNVPNHWQEITLGDLCARGGGNIQTGPFGSQLHASDYVQHGIPSIMPENLSEDRISTQGIARISKEDAERLSRYRVQSGDIVYSRRGDVTKRGLAGKEHEGWLCGTGCLRVRVGDGPASPRYAFYYLGHPFVRDWIVRHAIGATLPNLNTSIMATLPFLAPPLREQVEIAGILGALDDKIELNRRMNETLEAMARAIFKSWFVDFDPVRAKAEGRQPYGMDAATAALFPDSFQNSPLGKIPKGWRVGTLGDICTVGIGGDWGSDLPSEGLIKVRCLRGVDLEHLRDSGWSDAPARWVKESSLSKRALNACDVLIAASGLGPLGRSFWVSNGLHSCFQEPIIYSNFCKRLVAQSPEKGLYVDRVLHAMRQGGEIWEYATGTSIPNLDTNGLLGTHQIVVPSGLVLRRYYDFVLPAYKHLLSPESRTLAAIRDTLLPKLISGEIRVPCSLDPEAVVRL